MKMMPENLICFSHLRWDFVYQRPQHLLSRFAKNMNVYVIEEPVFGTENDSHYVITKREPNLEIIVPHLKEGLPEQVIENILGALFNQFMKSIDPSTCLFWYYTPMALKFTDRYKAKVTVYDCMDELSGFKFSHPELPLMERKLMSKADLVFTGGHSLYEAKKQYHSNIFPHPSSIDKKHFKQATLIEEAADQQHISGPKIGFYGVVDERFDIELLRQMADQRPQWQFVIIGPVVKIDPASLPANANIHYLGQKTYEQLPGYLAGWDVALIPFLLNESTKYISPTKTPEYLAAQIPVVSTAITDVIKPYGMQKLVHIGSCCDDFVKAIESELNTSDKEQWLSEVNEFLKGISWDKTFEAMSYQIKQTAVAATKISIAS